MPCAFISHSSPDDRYVMELFQFLRGLGYDEIFNDGHSIEPDAKFWEKIEAAILACDAFVVVLSHASVKSYWVDREVQFAREKGKKILPIRIDDCKPPSSFEGRDIIDLRQGRGDKVKIASSRILRHSPKHLFGREEWLDDLDAVWHTRTGVNVYALIAWGGAGKTSVVAHWVAERLAAKGWPGVERYFDWSFYSQGAREQSQTSADIFIASALAFFGDPDPQAGSAWERGERLARLVRQHRTLLVLDGIEPLQYPPNHPQAGEFKDAALAALLQGLAQDNPGLCVVTSRETLTTLQSFAHTGGTAEEKSLNKLHRDAALSLLRHLQITGTDEELEAAWRDAGGHALTLHLLGRFLADAHGSDIRLRKEVRLAEADCETPGRTAMKVLLAYEKWLASAGPERQRDLAVLRLTGLFDRPANAECLAALRAAPAISGLTDDIVGLKGWQWDKALHDLEKLELVTLFTGGESESAVPAGGPLGLDAHPLVREYFAEQLRQEQPDAWRAAHGRLFDHLCETAPECTRTEILSENRKVNALLQSVKLGDMVARIELFMLLREGEESFEEALGYLHKRVTVGEITVSEKLPTLADLQPLYQAVTHGCFAGRHQEALKQIYIDRIQRGTGPGGFYSTFKLGAIGPNLGAVAAFFDLCWSQVSPQLAPADQSWLLNEAAYSLRALGRLTEAREPMSAALEREIASGNWENAASAAGNLSGTALTLGHLGDAVAEGRRAIAFAERSGDAFKKMVNRTAAAAALHQAGERAEAAALFAEAERMQAERRPKSPLLYSVQGFRYVDLILAPAERAAWRAASSETAPADALAACAEATERAEQTLDWAKTSGGSLLDIALDHLTLARAALYAALLRGPSAASAADPPATNHLSLLTQEALTALRAANSLDDLPKALLTVAFYAGTLGGAEGKAEAERYLAEAQRIAERGPMPLYLADVHLYRARLFRDREELAKAAKLIRELAYGRRYEELADAEAASVDWPA